MSRVIPVGALLIATLIRRADDVAHPGVYTWLLDRPAGPGSVAHGLMNALPSLASHMPDSLAAGAPVTLTFHVAFSGQTFVSAVHFEIRKRVALQELADLICEGLPSFAERLFANLPQLVIAAPFEGVPSANAPTTGTPQ